MDEIGDMILYLIFIPLYKEYMEGVTLKRKGKEGKARFRPHRVGRLENDIIGAASSYVIGLLKLEQAGSQ